MKATFSAGTLGTFDASPDFPDGNTIQRVATQWVTNAAGSAIAIISGCVGALWRWQYIPNTTDVADAGTTITLKDESGNGVKLMDAQTLTSASAAQQGTISVSSTVVIPVPINSDLQLTIAAGGAAKGGTLVLYFR